MRHYKLFKKTLAALTAALLLGAVSAPACFAGIGEIEWVDTEQELVSWYQGEVREGMPRNALAIQGRVHLNAMKEKQISTFAFGLEIKNGAELILDNPYITILKGQPSTTPITVEPGGTLTIVQSFAYQAWQQPDPAIVIKKGGVLQGADILPEYIVISDENNPSPPPDTTDPPPDMTDPPPDMTDPPENDGRNPITSVFENDFRLICIVGERPAISQYPTAVSVAWLGYDQAPQVPISWDLTNVDFDTAGVYSAVGQLTQAGLDEYNLSNPNGFTVSMVVNVYAKAPTDELRGFLLETDPKGNTLIKLTMPALPMDEVTGVYIYRSLDEIHWQQESWSGQPGTGVFEKEANFRSLVHTEGRNSAIPYRYPTDGKTVWLRIEIVGSAMAGISNTICLETADLPPEQETASGDDSMGNRGGGGQTQTTRKAPKAQDALPPQSAAQQVTGNQVTGNNIVAATPQYEKQPSSVPPATQEEPQTEKSSPLNETPPDVPPREPNRLPLVLVISVAVALAGCIALGSIILIKRKR